MNGTVKTVLVVAAVVLLAAGIVGIFFPRMDAAVSPAEFQSYKNEIKADFKATNTRVDGVVGDMTDLIKTTTKGFEGTGQTKDALAALQAVVDKETAVQVERAKTNEQIVGRQLDAVRSDVAKSLAEAKNPQYQPYQQAYSGTANINGSGSFLIGQSGDYKIILNPPMPGTSISIDGRQVYNYQIVYLTQGYHTCYTSGQVQITWIWLSSY